MNDVEHDLRELFDRKASSVGGVASRLPEAVRKRSRHRQLGTLLVGSLTIVALVVGSLAALRAMDLGADRETIADDPWAGYQIFERTATIESITITSPSDWYLVNQWWIGAGTITSFAGTTETCDIDVEGSEDCETVVSSPSPVPVPEGLPLLQLSNIDLGLGMPRCGDRLTDEEAVLYVALEDATASRVTPPAWPSTLEERISGPCGPGLYSSFSAGASSFMAWVGFGAEASSEDRAELLTAFERMRVRDGAVRPPQTLGPAYVIAGGENGAGPWRLELQRSRGDGLNANVELHLQGSEGEGTRVGSFTVPKIPIEAVGGDPMFGAVTKEASGVELRLEAGTPPIPATIVPLPPSMPFDFDLFFASNDSDVPAEAVALGLEPGSSPSVPVADVSHEVMASGDTLGHPWTLQYDDAPGRIQLLLVDGRGTVLEKLGTNEFHQLHSSGLEYSSFTFSTTGERAAIVFGAVSPAATELWVGLDTGTTGSLRSGDPRWDPIPVPTSTDQPALRLWWFVVDSGHGHLATFNSSCDRLARTRLTTQTPVPSLPSPPPSVEPLCGDARLV
jgi:hypothetical protein